MSQGTVNNAMDRWQKGQVATSHPVRDITRKYVDVDDGSFGELVVWGYDPEKEIRQPREAAYSEDTLSYAIVSGVVTVTDADHGLEAGETVVITTDNYTPGPGAVLDGTYKIASVPTTGTFTFATEEDDRTGTLDADVAAFTIADVAGILSKSTSGGRARDFRTGTLTISTDDPVTVLQEGDIAVEYGNTVSAADDVYYDPSEKKYRNDATGSAVKIQAKFMQAGVLDDIGMIRFNTDATLGS